MFDLDPDIDHRTSWGTISNISWHIPAREAYMKVVPLSEYNIHKRDKPVNLYYQYSLDDWTVGLADGSSFVQEEF